MLWCSALTLARVQQELLAVSVCVSAGVILGSHWSGEEEPKVTLQSLVTFMRKAGWCGLGTFRDREKKQNCLSLYVSNSVSPWKYPHFCWFSLFTFIKEQTHHLTQETVAVLGLWCDLEDLTTALWDGIGHGLPCSWGGRRHHPG